MNTPGTVYGRNWKWKVPKGALNRRLSKKIKHFTKDLYCR